STILAGMIESWGLLYRRCPAGRTEPWMPRIGAPVLFDDAREAALRAIRADQPHAEVDEIEARYEPSDQRCEGEASAAAADKQPDPAANQAEEHGKRARETKRFTREGKRLLGMCHKVLPVIAVDVRH